jgi:UDP-N-acetylmuramoylalanine--D-glutamate ligase
MPTGIQKTAPTLGFHTLVVGLGKTGLSCVRYLRAQGISLAVTDSRVEPPGLAALSAELPDVPVFTGSFRSDVFATARELIVSPGVPMAEPLIQEAIARAVPVLGDVALFARAARAPICSITGSNGKSTVTTLLGQMAEACGRHVAVGGNLGEPVLDLLDEGVELYVVELSSFQLETTPELPLKAAACLNVSPDHLDRYPSLDDYVAAKARIYRDAEAAVINRDDPRVCAMPRQARLEIGFTLGEPALGDYGLRTPGGEVWLSRGSEPLVAASDLLIPGRHNLANALAALALAEACGLEPAPCIETLRRFPGLDHRSQVVAERRGVRWYNDSKGTNPGATIAALDGLVPVGVTHRAVLIAGGDGKGADFAPLAPVVQRATRAVVLIGRDAPRIAEVLEGRTEIRHAETMEEAVDLAAGLAETGDCVLLSPACASFDMFENYEHRGRAFCDAVRGLAR